MGSGSSLQIVLPSQGASRDQFHDQLQEHLKALGADDRRAFLASAAELVHENSRSIAENGDQQAATVVDKHKPTESQLRGVSLAWVLDRCSVVAWEKVQQKQQLLISSPHDESNEDLRRWETTEKLDIEHLNFVDLKTVLSYTVTGIGYGLRCPRDGKPHCSIVDGLYDSGDSEKATIFMSWVWKYTLKQALSALRYWRQNNKDLRRNQFIWWCFFCNNQYRLEQQESSTTLAEVFGTRLVTIGKMLIMLDKLHDPEYAKRAWCLFEVWVFCKEKMSDLQITISEEGIVDSQKFMHEGEFDLQKCLTIHSRCAQATKDEDKAFIMEQMKDKHSEVDKTVRDALLALVGSLVKDIMPMPASVEERVKLMIQIISHAQGPANDVKDKEVVFCIGHTGAGKSATINFLHGCKMQKLKENGEVRIDVAPESKAEKVAHIGHTNLSETDMPSLITIEDKLFCDCPGYEDRRGSDISIANTVSLHYVISASMAAKFVVIISYHCLVADRGKGVDDLLRLLLDLFGTHEQLESCKDAILLCISKAPRIDEDGEPITRDDIVSHFKTARELERHFQDRDDRCELSQSLHSICRQCVVYHPVARTHTSWEDRDGLLAAVGKLKAISGDCCYLAPDDHEVKKLRQLLKACETRFEDILKDSDHREAAAFLENVQKLMELLFCGKLSQSLLELQIEAEETFERMKSRDIQAYAFLLWQKAKAALDVLGTSDIQELKELRTPPPEVGLVCEAVMCLLAGIVPSVKADQEEHPLDGDWTSAQKMMSNPEHFLQDLLALKDKISAGILPRKNLENAAHKINDEMRDALYSASISKISRAAVHLCVFAVNIVMYFDAVNQIDRGQIQKELVILGSLYELYDDVMDTTRKFKECLWIDVSDVVDDWMVKIRDFGTGSKTMPKELKVWPAYRELRSEIELFNRLLPLLSDLSAPSIMPRHWVQVMTLTGIAIPIQQCCVQHFIDARADKYIDEVSEIVVCANNQLRIEKQLSLMSIWSYRLFEFARWKNRDFPYILVDSSVKELQKALEDDLKLLKYLLATPHSAPFQEEISARIETLSNTADTIELWYNVQLMWTSLESVFTSDDIALQMPMEVKKFAQLEKDWMKIMEKSVATQFVVRCCQDDLLLMMLPELSKGFETCQKSLDALVKIVP